MRELVLMILEEDIALCMQNFCIKCYRHGSQHISYIYFTLYLYSILTTQSARGMVPDAEVLDHLLIAVPDQVHPVPRPLPPPQHRL